MKAKTTMPKPKKLEKKQNRLALGIDIADDGDREAGKRGAQAGAADQQSERGWPLVKRLGHEDRHQFLVGHADGHEYQA